MKNKIKKILTATVVSAISFTAVGCSSNNTNVAKNIDKSMADFVSSINNLDYVDTAKAAPSAPSKYGKIVETAAEPQEETNNKKLDGRRNSHLNKIKVLNGKNSTVQFLNNNIDEVEIENTITRPAQRSDNFKLFVLSDSPFISLTSDDNSASLNMSIKFSTNKIENTSTEIESKINTLILKRSILMIYVNEIYNGNVNFSKDNKVAINAYVNVIKENTSYLNGNRGMVKNQLGLASNLANSESNENLINYYIIKSGEALETRASKLDSAISAIDSIIKIIESSLSENSNYYKSNLSSAYDNVLNSIGNGNFAQTEITKDSTNKEIADNISSLLNFGHTPSTSVKPEENNQNNNQTNNTIYKNDNLLNKTNNTNNTTNSTNTLQTNPQNQKYSNQNLINKNNEQKTNLNNQNSQNNQFNQSNLNQFNKNQQYLRDNTNQQLNKNNNLGNNILNNSQSLNNNNQNTMNQNLTNNQTNNQTNNRLGTNRNQFYKMPTLRLNKNIANQNSNEMQTSNKDDNASKEVNIMNNESEKIMRADRTPEKQKIEEYTSSNARVTTMEERPSTIPYTNNHL